MNFILSGLLSRTNNPSKMRDNRRVYPIFDNLSSDRMTPESSPGLFFSSQKILVRCYKILWQHIILWICMTLNQSFRGQKLLSGSFSDRGRRGSILWINKISPWTGKTKVAQCQNRSADSVTPKFADDDHEWPTTTGALKLSFLLSVSGFCILPRTTDSLIQTVGL